MPFGEAGVLTRIVSLLPSATEIVYCPRPAGPPARRNLRLRFPQRRLWTSPSLCPAAFRTQQPAGKSTSRSRRPLVSSDGIYVLHLDTLEAARPDLVLTQALCEVCAVPSQQVHESLQKLHHQPQVLSLDPHSLADVVSDVQAVGAAAGAKGQSKPPCRILQSTHGPDCQPRLLLRFTKPRVVCLEWLNPLMVGGHWVP